MTYKMFNHPTTVWPIYTYTYGVLGIIIIIFYNSCGGDHVLEEFTNWEELYM